MNETQKTENARKSDGISQEALDLGATVISAGLGAAVAHNTIQDTCYQQYKGTFDELELLRTNRRAEEKAVKSKIKSGELKGPAWREYARIKTQFKKDSKEIFKDHDLRNDLDYWRVLTPTNRVKVAERVFTSAGIALGVLLTIANVKNISRAFSHNDDRKSDAPER